MLDYYEILEVNPNATQEQIKAQYHFLAQAWHPDKFNSPESKAKAEEKLKRINEAYSVLIDPVKRQNNDNQRQSTESVSDYPEQQPEVERKRSSQEPDFAYQNQEAQKPASHAADSGKLRQAENALWNTLILELIPGVTMEFVRVPAGEFLMGSRPDQDGAAYPDEQPQHKIHLDEYLIGKFPVTNRQYRTFFQASGHIHREIGTIPSNISPNPGHKDNHPVVSVSWQDAIAFCAWVSTITRQKVYLPSEAQWEKAARGPDGRVYPWGNNSPSNNLLNYNRSLGDTREVGKYPAGASPYGALDMAGNAWEWVNDIYDEHYYQHSPSSNPAGPTTGEYHVLRGGSWASNAANVRSAIRLSNLPKDAGFGSGFRCSRDK